MNALTSAKNFLYNWSELALAPVNWTRFGLATQRTRAYQADRVVQHGVLVNLILANTESRVPPTRRGPERARRRNVL